MINADGECKQECKGKIPAYHRWQDTLKEVNRDMGRTEPHGITGVKHRVGRQLNPSTSSLTDSQARELAIETGTCSDGMQCGTFAETAYYCDDCPNAPHVQDARRLDERLVADMRSVTSAQSILSAASQHMQDRASTYDKPQGERSMAATVSAFRATSGIALTEEQGWHFMALLKLVRSQQGNLRLDSYEDGAAYFALAGEAAAKHR